MFSTGFGVQSQSGHNPNKDAEVSESPGDGISSLRFSPTANNLVATSWDCSVRMWEVSAGQWGSGNLSAQPKAMTNHSQPVLCSDWTRDGTGILFGSTDGQAKLWNVATNQSQQIAQHQGGIKEIFFVPDLNQVVTGSWDKTLKYWDTRSSNPTFSYNLPERCYSMDVVGSLMVVATADKHILIFDLRNPSAPAHQEMSPLKWQTRCVACFADQKGYFIGSIEGRVGVQHIGQGLQSKNFTFKCHRQNNTEVYAVNSIAVHPQYGTFATAGSDGCFHYWDKDWKRRLKAMERCNQPISCSAFNGDGKIYAYAVSYDWSRGCQHYNPQSDKNYVMLHPCTDADVKPTPAKGSQQTRRR